MPDPSTRSVRLSTRTIAVVAVLLIIPCAALAAVPIYSRETPRLWGIPFFYWYQLMWVLLTPILTYSAYLVIKRARGER
ncbi:MAG: hypothetical protein QOG01_3366 [Pseudonocardiales bacterium]|jgi:hypothetical protein|nr:hypothetical protein [Pseudonocardiales bacterium]